MERASTAAGLHGEPASPRVEEVAEGVFAYVQPPGGWWVNNTGFLKDGADVVAIDTCSTEQRTRAFAEAVERVCGRLPRAVVNTHHHGDHTNGNCLFPEATILGQTRCREEVIRNGIMRPDGIFEPVDWGELVPAPPIVTFDDRLDVHVGDMLVELRHIGTAAHTTNDVLAWVPEHGVLFTGDLVFNGGTPFVLMGSVSGSLVALDEIAQYDAKVIVPGHGDVCTPSVIDVVGEYLRFLQETALKATSAGVSALEAAREVDLDAVGFGDLLEPERLVGNLHRAMAECRGTKAGEPVDLLSAFSDMLTMNDGRPLRCSA